ncbi:MAG: hypothetical protein HY247_01860 [archaeon]|nr:MAG: hypothetical protein HY247_01860 [archaeon]
MREESFIAKGNGFPIPGRGLALSLGGILAPFIAFASVFLETGVPRDVWWPPALVGSLVICCAAVVGILISNAAFRRMAPLGDYHVSIIDSRDQGDALRLDYVNPKGMRWQSLRVIGVVAKPKEPLYKPGARHGHWVKGTRSSIEVKLALPSPSRKKFFLVLGFPDESAMTAVCDKFGPAPS